MRKHWKTLLILALCFAAALPMMTGTALAEVTVVTGGNCGASNLGEGVTDKVTWTFYSDRTLRVSGQGAIYEFGKGQDRQGTYYPWYECSGDVKTLIIENGITIIPTAAFGYCRNITSATISEDVTFIGDRAFMNSTLLSSVTLGSALESIGQNAFGLCSSLTEAEFLGAPPLSVGANAFPSASVSPSFRIIYPKGSTDWTNPWNGYPTEMKGKYDYMDETEDFSTLYPISGVSNVYCNNQGVIFTLESNNKASVGTRSSFSVPGATGFPYYPYQGTVGHITIPNKVRTEDGQEYSVTLIRANAFEHNQKLKKLTIGQNVEKVEPGAFFGCSNLATFVVDENNSAFQAIQGILYDKKQDGTVNELYVFPAAAVLEKAFTIPATATTIGYGAFYGCHSDSIKELVIPKTIELIRPHAFENVTGLEKLTVVGNESSRGLEICEQAFMNCTSLRSATFEGGNQAIDNQAFMGCTSLQSVDIIDGVKTIGNQAFGNCSSLISFNMVKGGGTMGDQVFMNCTGLKSAYIRSGVETIGYNLFTGCSNLETVYIYSGVKSIGRQPLAGCNNLKALFVPFLGSDASTPGTLSSLFAVDNNSNNDSQYKAYTSSVPGTLRKVIVAGGTLSENAFANSRYFSGSNDRTGTPRIVHHIEEIVLGRSINVLPHNCFRDCTDLKYLEMTPDFPLDEKALDTDLTDQNNELHYAHKAGVVEIRSNINTIRDYVFRNCAQFSQFIVEEDNTRYDNDVWGALYTEGCKMLICYPPAAGYSYYCIAESANHVTSFSFYNCDDLDTINFPGKDTGVSTTFIYPQEPPRITVYAHEGSSAEIVLGRGRVHSIEQLDPVGVRIERLSDNLAFEYSDRLDPTNLNNRDADSEHQYLEFKNFYLVAEMPGAGAVLLDQSNCVISAKDPKGFRNAGAQTLTAIFTGKDDKEYTVDFNTYFFKPQKGYVISEHDLPSEIHSKATKGFAALYHAGGKMLAVSDQVSFIDNTASNNVFRAAVYLPDNKEAALRKLFVLDSAMCPVSEPVVEDIAVPEIPPADESQGEA